MIFVIPDGIGDADTDIPHLWFLGASHPAAECPSFLRMLDLRHIRLLTAQVEELGLSVYHHWMCEAKKSVAYCVEIRKGSPE